MSSWWKNDKQFIDQGIVILLVLVGMTLRLLPHPPNFAPVAAVAIFGGAKLKKPLALSTPLLTMFLSDLVIGLHKLILFTWGAFLLVALLSYFWLREEDNFKQLFTVTLASSILFFLITNFGVWLEGRLYPITVGGLISSYTMAIPFFKNTLLGNFFYTGVLFSLHALAKQTTYRLADSSAV